MDDINQPLEHGDLGSSPPTRNGNSHAAALDMLKAIDLEPEDVLALIWAVGRIVERNPEATANPCPNCGHTE